MSPEKDKLAGRSGGDNVFPLAEGEAAPPGYIITLINNPLAPGVHAVKVNSKCQECWGKGTSTVDGEHRTCSCVLRRIDKYVLAGGD